MSQELKFASSNEAFQYLANVTGKRVLVANDAVLDEMDKLTQYGNKVMSEQRAALKDLKDSMIKNDEAGKKKALEKLEELSEEDTKINSKWEMITKKLQG